MRRVLLAVMILGLAGCAAPRVQVSPYLNGVNVSYTDKWLRGQPPSGTVPSAAKIFKVVRFPGGLLADEYHWISGVGPGLKDGQTGTKGFAEFCEGIGAEKMITVNFKTGRVEEAANWVEFANAEAPEKIPDEWKMVPYAYNHKAPEGYFAYLRESMERKQPYAVKFWEIGNEIDWWNRIDADSYAQEVVNYARAMRAKDKNIFIGACGSPLDDKWNERVLKIAGRDIDFLIIHIYGGPDKSYQDKGEEYRVLFSKLDVVEQRIKKIKELVKKYASRCKIAVTEGNTSYNEFKLGADELKKWKSALWIAGLRNVLMRQGVMAYCHWNLSDGGTYGLVNEDGSVTPAYEVLKLYGLVHSSSFIVHRTDDAALGHGGRLDTVMMEDKEKKRAYVAVVNTGAEAIEANIQLRGQSPSGTVPLITLKAGDDLGLESRSVKIEEGECAVEGGKIKYKFEPESVTVMELDVL